MQKGKVCIFTGHRVIQQEHVAALPDLLDMAVVSAYEMGCRNFWSGGALGFDRMAADAVIRARNCYGDIRLGILVPCRDQDRSWSEEERSAYRYQLAAADEVEVLSEQYYQGCMRDRNAALVARGDVCIAYMIATHSGSAQTLKMAEAHHLNIVNLAYLIREEDGVS